MKIINSISNSPRFGSSTAIRLLLIAGCNLVFLMLLAFALWQIASYQSRELLQLRSQTAADVITKSLNNANQALTQFSERSDASCAVIYSDLRDISTHTPYFRAVYILNPKSKKIFCSSSQIQGEIDIPQQQLFGDKTLKQQGVFWNPTGISNKSASLIVYQTMKSGNIILGILDAQYYKDMLELIMGESLKTAAIQIGEQQLVHQNHDFFLIPTQEKDETHSILIKRPLISIITHYNDYQLKKYITNNLPWAFLLTILFLLLSSTFIWRRLGEKSNFNRQVLSAIHQQQFIPYYQPVIGLQGAISGVEVLIRWQHPDLGLLSPALFIQQAESQGLLTPIMLSLIKKIEDDLINKPIPKQSRVGINITAQQLNDQSMLNAIFALNAKLKHIDYQLVIELTEEGLVSDPDLANKIIQEMGQAGIMVAIDDFGIGHSSLASLSRFPFHYLKVDKSFVDHIVSREKDQIIVANMVDMARQLNLNIVAEGVENKDQADYLALLGIDYLQGFYFSKPLPLNELVRFQFDN